MVEIQRRLSEVSGSLLVQPLLGKLFGVARPVRTRAGLRKRDLWVVAPMKTKRHHPLPRAIAFCGPIVAEGSKQPSRGAAVVANRHINLDHADWAKCAFESRDRPLVPPGRIVVDEDVGLP